MAGFDFEVSLPLSPAIFGEQAIPVKQVASIADVMGMALRISF
jgi:hypothetical protein